MQRRTTEHKKKILALFEKEHVLSAKDIETHLSSVDPSTIYRNLERFVSDGVIREVNLQSAERYFERVESAPHYHFVCELCECITSFTLPHLSVSSALPKKTEVHSVDVLARGICTSCAHT